jgi:2-methylcitrate dehydratase PrpD
MKDPKVLSAKARVELVADKSLMDPTAPRSSRVEVTLKDGRTVSHFMPHAPGTKENPMTTEEVNAKARSLMVPVLGAGPTEEIIRRVNALESVKDVRELMPFLTRHG